MFQYQRAYDCIRLSRFTRHRGSASQIELVEAKKLRSSPLIQLLPPFQTPSVGNASHSIRSVEANDCSAWDPEQLQRISAGATAQIDQMGSVGQGDKKGGKEGEESMVV